MSHYKFHGRLRCEDTKVKIDVRDGPMRIDLNYSDGRVSKLEIDFKETEFSFDIETGEPVIKGDLQILRDEMNGIARSIYDAIGYLRGRALPVDINAATNCDSGEKMLFVDIVTALETNKAERPLDIGSLVPLVMKSIYLRRALGDLREAILSPSDIAFFCFRAIEDIRQQFSAVPENVFESWKRMSVDLRIRQSFTEEIRQCSMPIRHGQPVALSGQKRIEFLIKAWKIVDRFTQFLYGGEKALTDYIWLE